MTNEFKQISSEEETRYVLECSSAGTTAGAIASVEMPMGGTRKREDSLIAQEAGQEKVKQKPRQGPLRTQTGGGAHTDKTKVIPRKEKYKKSPEKEIAESTLKDKEDLAAKRKALQDLSMNKDVDQKHVQQRKLDLEKEAKKKGLSERYDEWDEADVMYRWEPSDGTVRQRHVTHAVKNKAYKDGYKDSVQDVLKSQNIIRSKFDKNKYVQKQGSKWVEVFPFGEPGGIEIDATEGGYDYHRPDPVWITINGKKWKWFFNYVQGRKAMDTLNAKFRTQGSNNKADWEPADLEDNPDHGIKVGESALEKFRQDSAERTSKHDKIETDRKAAAAQGKTNVPGAIDRLQKQLDQAVKEAGIPSSVISLKQKLDAITPEQLLNRFQEVAQSTGKSVEELARSMAWRHGYGKNSDHYWNIIQRAETGGIETEPEMGERQVPESIEPDHEGDTVKNSLHTIIRVATHLEKNISDEEQFPEWVSEKVGAIHSMMVTVMNYVISDHEQQDGDRLDQGPTEDHSTATGGWGQGSMNAAYKSSALAGAGHDDRAMESDEYFNKLKETLEAAITERSKSQAQWNLMHAVAHNPAFAKKVGVKQSVGQEFSAADAGHDPKSLPKRVVSKKKK